MIESIIQCYIHFLIAKSRLISRPRRRHKLLKTAARNIKRLRTQINLGALTLTASPNGFEEQLRNPLQSGRLKWKRHQNLQLAK